MTAATAGRRSRDLYFKTFSHGGGGPISDVTTAPAACVFDLCVPATVHEQEQYAPLHCHHLVITHRLAQQLPGWLAMRLACALQLPELLQDLLTAEAARVAGRALNHQVGAL
jgi:hypothetical protein